MSSLFPGEQPVACARIAVERGIDRFPEGLTYGIPAVLGDIQPGQRVLVPLGRGDRLTGGYVVQVSTVPEVPPEGLKLIHSLDAAAARLPDQLIDLARWISSYYCAPIGMTLATMLPAAVKRNIGTVTRAWVDLGTPVPLDGSVRLPAKQRQLLHALAELDPADRPVEQRKLMDMAGVRTVGPIKKLLQAGHLEAVRRTSIEASWIDQAPDPRVPEALTDDQQRVIGAISPILDAGFSTHLIYGVTGSGKTEVYVRLIKHVLARDRTALMLVPEIALTPQTGGRLIGRFPKHRVAVLHSGLTAAQRHQQWSLVASGEAQVVLGARSAVFAPIPPGKLGLVIIDEEHDGSYKQDQVPRYHGRDVGVKRAHLADCPILLGTATPSLESWHNATERGTYRLHRMMSRVPGMRLPVVRVVDFAEQRRQRKDKRVHLLGPIMEAALARTLDEGAQALILLNRRGYANYIACPDATCGWVMTCDHCDVTMVYHRPRPRPRPRKGGAAGFVRCHHCLTEQKLPVECPESGHRISTFGLGTQRVEEELQRKFTGLEDGTTLLRMDSDTMRTARHYHEALARFGRGEIRVLLGTQMIAKGLDYPNVRLVGVINADTSINLPDFRATERTFQLVNQVAGRSGRSSDPNGMGLVIVQSFNPQTPAIQFAAAHDYESFAEEEIRQRRDWGLPPITRMTRIVLRDDDHIEVVQRAQQLANALHKLAGDTIRVRGPAPCPIARIAGKHRQQVEILGPDAAAMQGLLTAARNAGLIISDTTMAVDVDPIAML